MNKENKAKPLDLMPQVFARLNQRVTQTEKYSLKPKQNDFCVF